MRTIHDEKCFTREEILNRAEKHEYPNPLAVELFLWDCELAAQLQHVCDDLVLKGGAAAQLFLPLEKQRGSVDIDLVTPLEKTVVTETIKKVDDYLEGDVRFKLYNPKSPNPKLSLITYFAEVPSETNQKRSILEIKIDLMYDCPELPNLLLKDVQTYAVPVKKLKCSTVGTLLGDKLLTLAKGSIGLDVEVDYPKQIYDVDALLESNLISGNILDDMLTSIKVLTKLEASFKNLQIAPSEALHDVIQTMTEYSLVDTSGGDMGMKRNINTFQQFLVNRSQRRPYYEWSSKCLKIRFLAALIENVLRNKLNKTDIIKIMTSCQDSVARLHQISGNAITELRNKILSLAMTRIKHFKELRGKTLERVFWEVVTIENLPDLKVQINNF